ncbi:MAG: D-serine deaminase-like pyridoxal phosphate-dependent protein [Cyclobacteriaceae bacterium]|jgi:D-serine deaminase-like pyridoxal phosphate-dependent protein
MTIKRPTLIVDEAQARRNIQKIVELSRRHNLTYRPHFKTHQSRSVGQWYREAGITKITVSSVVMAAYFAADGWDDIVIAFPYNLQEWQEIEELAKQTKKLSILIESHEALSHATSKIRTPLHYDIAVDVGYQRTGVPYENVELISQLIDFPTHHQLRGLLTHAGHTYKARTKKQVEEIHHQSTANLLSLKNSLDQEIFTSYGDTPSCSISNYWEGIDEIRCGNVVYYDLTQAAISSCTINEISVAVACPVVAKHLDRSQLIVYGGGVHFSKEVLQTGEGPVFGKAVLFDGMSWTPIKGVWMESLSQEHGKVSGPKDWIETVNLGDIIGFLPVHSCMAADLLTLQQTLTGSPLQKMSTK